MTNSSMSSQPSAADDDLDRKHKRSQIRAGRAQVVGVLVSALAVLVAGFVAWQGQIVVNHNSQTTQRQSEDSQLSTAITALGSSDTAERIAGLLLLSRNTSARFSLFAETGEAPADVYDDYTTALQILSGYLNTQGEAFLTDISTGRPNVQFGRGYGIMPPPGLPLDVTYAADQVRFLLTSAREKDVTALHDPRRPAIDLSDDELSGQPWSSVNFGWINADLFGVDLRGADIASSQWSENSDLSHAHLQCANLQDANFRGADLTNADLRGANVQGADFRGAHLAGANLKQLYGIAKWSQRPQGTTVLPVKKWNPYNCLQNSRFWDNQPTSASSPTPLPSLKTSSSSAS